MKSQIRKIVTNSPSIVSMPFYILYNFLLFKVQYVQFTHLPKINGFISVMNRGRISFGENVVINSSRVANPVGNCCKMSLYCLPSGRIEIGNNVAISNTLIYSQKEIIIEDNVMIGGGTQIWDTDFHPTNLDDRLSHNISKITCKKVRLCKGCFIGASSIILKGIVVGENAIVGAGSVITHNIGENEIWAGNPARFIKKIQ